MRIILPAQVFFLCGACVTALLYMRRQFRVPALAPLIYNGCIIAGGLLLPWLTQGMALPAEWELGGMTGYCVGVTVGAGLGAFLLPFRVAAAGGLRLSPVFRHPLLKRFLIMALPLMLGQTVIFLDEQFMRVFGSLVGDGAVSLLNYARRIMQVPVGLMGQAAAVASYPFLVSLLTSGEKERFDQTLSAALRASVGLIIPCALWMGVAARPIMGVIFQGGRFGLAETVASTPLLQIMLAATPLWIVYMVLVRAFYADGDTLTPATTGTAMTLLALPVYYWWAVPLGAWAIALTSAVSVSAYVLWLVAIWARRQGTGAFAGLLSLSGRALLCSLPAGAASWAAQYGLDSLRASGVLALPAVAQACLACAASGLAFAVVFLPLSCRLAPGILEPVWRRLRRGRPQGQA